MTVSAGCDTGWIPVVYAVRTVLRSGPEPARMRGKLDTDTLLSIVLALVVAWLVLGVVSEFLTIFGTVLVVLPNLLGLAVISIIVLWWFDYI